MIHSFIKSSFDTFLKLQEVMHFNKLVTMFAETWTETPRGEKKLDFVMAWLNRLCSEEDSNDGFWNETEHEHQAKLFE